jgi:hypothetical protein
MVDHYVWQWKEESGRLPVFAYAKLKKPSLAGNLKGRNKCVELKSAERVLLEKT